MHPLYVWKLSPIIELNDYGSIKNQFSYFKKNKFPMDSLQQVWDWHRSLPNCVHTHQRPEVLWLELKWLLTQTVFCSSSDPRLKCSLQPLFRSCKDQPLSTSLLVSIQSQSSPSKSQTQMQHIAHFCYSSVKQKFAKIEEKNEKTIR